jgi:hypothetical protein
VSSYCCICDAPGVWVEFAQEIEQLHMCPRTAVHAATYVSSYCHTCSYICVLFCHTCSYMCPRTAIHVAMCVLELLHMRQAPRQRRRELNLTSTYNRIFSLSNLILFPLEFARMHRAAICMCPGTAVYIQLHTCPRTTM